MGKGTKAILCLLTFCLLHGPASAGVRIKDITDFEGARNNQLYGFGLVVGLDGTGSRSLFTQQVAVDMLKKLSVTAKIFQDLPSDNVLRSGNIAAVMITTEIGPYARQGSRLDVTVSCLDDSSSLHGGTLILTPLRGADGDVYAVAQGPLSVGGFSFGGRAASVQKNHPTVARIPGGATVEHEARGEILCQGHLRLLLKEPDFETATAIGVVINAQHQGSALVLDAGTVQVALPPNALNNLVAFANELGQLEITPDSTARVVINERTGTIVAGEQVKVSTVAIAHGNLAIVKSEEPQVSQPNPLARGRTVVVPRTKVGVTEQPGALQIVDRTITVGSLARALNALGVSPRDLICIFQTLKTAGALHAELIIQ